MSDIRAYFRCYDPRFLGWTIVAAVVLVAAAAASKAFEPATVPRVALAGVQAIALGAVIVAIVVRMRRLDELQRRIQFESLALAFAISCASIAGWGFFDKAGLPSIDWGLWAWPFMVLVWVASLLFVRKRYE